MTRIAGRTLPITGLVLSAVLAVSAAGALPAAAQSGDEARIAALKERIVDLNRQAQKLEDINQIRRLQQAYGYYIDRGYWNQAADLFAADATMEVGVDGIWRGQDRIRELITRQGGGNEGPGLPFGQLNHHMQLQPVITVAEDGHTAMARWRDFSMLGQYQESAHWGDAVMENTYVKEDGVWKIKSFHYYPNFVAPYEGGWASLEPVEGDWTSDIAKAFPPDAGPSEDYKPFPDIFVPPFHYGGPPQPDQAAVTKPLSPGGGEIGALETMAEGYARKLAILESEREIENLQAMYGYYIDKGLWQEAAALFAEDGAYEFGQRGVYVGPERIAEALSLMGPEGLEQGQLNNYPMLQPIVSVAEDNKTAKARWRSDVQLSRDGKGRWGAGVYENEYVNVDGVWRISKLYYYVTMWTNYDKGWHEEAIPMEGPSEELPPDQPPTVTYEAFPTTNIVPYHYPHPVTGEPYPGVEGDAQ